MEEQAHSAISHSDIVVDLSGVCKTFHQKQRSERIRDIFSNLVRPQVRQVDALKDVTLQIHRGEVVAYAGPNGAGKSTTIKILSSLLTPDSGTVRVLGMDPKRERIRYVNRIGVVFGQRTELWWDQPVAATFEWKRVVWNIPRDRFEKSLEFVKEVLGLHDYFNSLARELSLGQRMRADMGLALLHEPEILFLDEPTIGVDVLAKRNMLDFVKELNRTRGVTIVLTSHDMSELEQLAGRMIMVDRGSIAFDGDFATLRRQFTDRRHLYLETDASTAPVLSSAELVRSDGNRHEFTFDAGVIGISEILEQVSAQTQVIDVETHRVSIDDVIADLYKQWNH